MKVFIGIDPGASGGIAAVSEGGGYVMHRTMPETEADLLEVLRGIGGGHKCHAVLERVWSSPQMGVASAFKFGVGVGTLRMALTAAEIPFDEVVPSKWQRVMECQVGTSRATLGSKGGNKNITKRRAQQLFPFLTKITHATADALLLAEYARRTFEKPVE